MAAQRAPRLGLPIVLAALLGPCLVGGINAQSNQTSAPSAERFRTPWGDPDLQGIWNGVTLTPLERPARFRDKPVLSETEAATVVAEVFARPGRESRTAAGTDKDVAGAYNQLFVQRGEQLSDRRTSLIVDPPNGRTPPMTPEAATRTGEVRDFLQALLQGTSGGRPGPPSPRHADPSPVYNVERINRANGPEDRSLPERCLAGILPNMNALYQIVQAPGQVGIYLDSLQGAGFARVIPVNGSTHLPPSIRFWNGDARGRWDGDTLVVDITNFNHKREFLGSRENLHLVERFTRVSQNRLEYTLTVEDPTVWAQPWTLMVPWSKESDKANQIYEATCHEGNYGMLGMLANTRAAERKFRQGTGPDPCKSDIATGADAGGGIEREGVN